MGNYFPIKSSYNACIVCIACEDKNNNKNNKAFFRSPFSIGNGGCVQASDEDLHKRTFPAAPG